MIVDKESQVKSRQYDTTGQRSRKAPYPDRF